MAGVDIRYDKVGLDSFQDYKAPLPGHGSHDIAFLLKTSLDLLPHGHLISDKKDIEKLIRTYTYFHFVLKSLKSLPFLLFKAAGIEFGKVITSFTGLRSVGSTGDFIINSPKEGFINAAGIESPGLSSSPAIALYVRDMLRDMGVELVEKQNYIKTRKPMHWFSELTRDEKNEVIATHPEYAHVVCRCERVTEGEILYAIRTNPKPRDVDGVKRRTRATMGRCQGGFCTPYIIELLANEMNCDYTAVTKFGGGSYINLHPTKGEVSYDD